ncbi:MAG: alanine racemase, partial [Oscillospiraceae bacterium]|nr:alanine racemase [Oscillospiraceae bacterium]
MNPNRAEAFINLENAKHNYLEIRRMTSAAHIICVIKANAYGHGAVRLAQLYESLGADILAVACLSEALELRESGIKMPVMIFGATPPDCADILSEHRIIQSVHSLEYAKALNDALESSGKTLAVHIKLDTGMSRLGIYAHHGF